jgi:hypothetical protein
MAVTPELSSPLEVQYHSFPLYGWFLEVDEEAETHAGGAPVVQALRHMLIGQAVDAFQFNDQHVFHEDIGIVFANTLTFIDDRERGL